MKVNLKTRAFPAAQGLDQTSIPGNASPFSMYDGDRVIFTVNGSRKKYWGLNTYYRSGFGPTITQDMRGMFDYYRTVSSVQTHKTVVFAGAKVWADSADGRFSDITGTATLTADDQVTFDVFEGYLIMGFTTGLPQVWDMTGNIESLNTAAVAAHGQAIPGGGAAARFSLCRIHRRRLWLAGNPDYPHRLYYSSADDPLDWRLPAGGGSAGYMDLDSGDADPVGITSIFPSFYDDLHVAKRRSLYRVREVASADLTSTTFQIQPVVKGIGCSAHNSVVATPTDIIWASDRGIHSLASTDKYGDVEASFLSFPIHEKYRSTVNFALAKNMWAVYDPGMNSYLLAYTRRGQRTNTELIGYNVTIGQLYSLSDYDCAALATFVDRTFKPVVLVGQEVLNIGYLDEDKTSDFGVGRTMYFTTPIIYAAGAPDIEIGFKALWLFYRPQESGTIGVSYQIDGKETETATVDQTGTGSSIIGAAVIGQGVIGGTGTIKKSVIPLRGTGSGIQITFSNVASTTDPDEDCEIYGYIIEFEGEEDSNLPSVTASTE